MTADSIPPSDRGPGMPVRAGARPGAADRYRAADATDPADADRTLRLAFAPIHKRAFGVAVGVTAGLAVFLLTAFRLLAVPEEVTYLSLLSQFLAGYEESWTGAVIGLAWGFVVGFVAGWFAAFVRNLVLATYLFAVRTRADLLATRDFLDHI